MKNTVVVTLSRTMKVSQEDLEFLKIAEKEGDMQMFLEMTELNYEGTISVIKVTG